MKSPKAFFELQRMIPIEISEKICEIKKENIVLRSLNFDPVPRIVSSLSTVKNKKELFARKPRILILISETKESLVRSKSLKKLFVKQSPQSLFSPK